MEWEDKKLTELRNQERKKQYINLETGMYVKDQLIRFQRQTIEKLEMSVVLPLDFTQLKAEEMQIRYPSSESPDVAMGNTARNVTFAFSKLKESAINEEQMKTAVGITKDLLKSANPSLRFLDDGMVKSDNLSGSWFGFKSYVIGGAVYNFSMIACFNGRNILGMFSCPYGIRYGWNEIFLKISETFRTENGKERRK